MSVTDRQTDRFHDSKCRASLHCTAKDDVQPYRRVEGKSLLRTSPPGSASRQIMLV